MGALTIPLILTALAALAGTSSCDTAEGEAKASGSQAPHPDPGSRSLGAPDGGASPQDLRRLELGEMAQALRVPGKNPSVDGKFVVQGESAMWLRVQEWLEGSLPLKEEVLSQKLNRALGAWFKEPLPKPLSKEESQRLLQHLEKAREQTKAASPYHSLLTWAQQDLQLALDHQKGVYPFIRKYGEEDSFKHFNDDPDLIRGIKQVLPHWTEPTKKIPGHFVDYSFKNNTPDAKFIFILADAHLPDTQIKVSETVRRLQSEGFETLFSESSPYHPRRTIPVPQQIRIGLSRYYRGAKAPEVLKGWPTPRAAKALAFYFGEDLKVFGSEDPMLYRNFSKFAESALEDYLPRHHERSLAMAENVSRHMTGRSLEKALFILGGAHVDSVGFALEKRGINHVVFVPEGSFHPRFLADYRRTYFPPKGMVQGK